MMILSVISVLWGAAATWVDCRRGRLPNGMTVGAAVLCLCYRLGYGGVSCFADGFAAGAAGGACLLVPFVARAAGGGDVKMLFAAGTMAGWDLLLPMLWYTALAGLVMGSALYLAVLVGKRARVPVSGVMSCIAASTAGPRSWREAIWSEGAGLRTPFSPAIAAGLLGAMCGG